MVDIKSLGSDEIKKIHTQYEKLKSLNKTAKWVQHRYNFECTRHHLSHVFHKLGLPVQPPNGRDNTTKVYNFVDKVSEFAADMIEAVWSDIKKYEATNQPCLDWCSACWFVASGMYDIYLHSVFRGLRAMAPLATETLPDGVDAETIIEGNNWYKCQFEYWVCNKDW